MHAQQAHNEAVGKVTLQKNPEPLGINGLVRLMMSTMVNGPCWNFLRGTPTIT